MLCPELHAHGNTTPHSYLPPPPLFPSPLAAVTERMQLGPADACLLHMLYPESHEHGDASEHKDSTGRMALKMASTWHFPREDIRATPLMVGEGGLTGGGASRREVQGV